MSAPLASASILLAQSQQQQQQQQQQQYSDSPLHVLKRAHEHGERHEGDDESNELPEASTSASASAPVSAPPLHTASSASPGAAPKQPNIKHACVQCHARKMRCDGMRPCARCARDDDDCTYAAPKKRGRPRKVRKVEQETTPPTASTSTAAAAARGSSDGGVNVLPRRVLDEIATSFFDKLGGLLPIVDRESFMADLASRRDRTDRHFLHLVVNLCAAAAAGLQGEAFPEASTSDLGKCFSSWEDAARFFNTSQPPRRLREMFQDRHVSVLQNILLVATYERAFGSPIAYHLTHEAVQFAIAYGYHRLTASDVAASRDADTGNRVLWQLYIWDKIVALSLDEPMSLRSDEVDAPRPDNVPFLAAMVHVARQAEHEILRHRAQARAQSDVTPTLSIDEAPVLASANESLCLFTFRQFVSIELLRRYRKLFDPTSLQGQTLSCSVTAAAETLLARINSVQLATLDLMGPFYVDMVERAVGELEDVLEPRESVSADGVLHAKARDTLTRYRDHVRPSIDKLRRVNNGATASLPVPLVPSHYAPAPSPRTLDTAVTADQHSAVAALLSSANGAAPFSPSDDFQQELAAWMGSLAQQHGNDVPHALDGHTRPPPEASGSLLWLGNLPYFDVAANGGASR